MKDSNYCIKQCDIFTGTIKKCDDIYFYERYGESRFVPSYRTCSTVVGSTHFYSDVVEENTLLIKVDDDNYVRVQSLNGFFEVLFANRGIAFHTIGTRPHFDGDYYVDKETVVPYFKSNENGRINVKSLKKLK